MRIGFALLMMGCGADTSQSDWSDQVSPSGPCWEVNILDGLDESSTEELHSLFDCLNQGGNLDPFSGVVDALDANSRSGIPLGVELVLLVNDLPEVEVDVFGFASFGLDLIEQEPELIGDGLAVVVELMYGDAYADIVASGPASSASALDSGVIRPALPVIAQTAGSMLDDGPGITAMVADALASEAAADGVCTVVALSTDPTTADLTADITANLGAAIQHARSPDNDRWEGASGDSLRDLVEVMLLETGGDSQTLIEALSPDLLAILTDDALRDRLLDALDSAERDDLIDPLPQELLYLASVDIDGNTLSVGGDSALLSLLRMLHAANGELSCSIDVFGFFEFDNLSVEILGLLAQQDPGTVASGLELLGPLLGNSVVEWLIDGFVGLDTCPLLTPQLVSDLDAINRLNDDDAANLVIVMLDLLGAFYQNDSTDKTTELVTILSRAYARGTVPPIEEALRDLAGSDIARDLTDLVPVLLDPSDLTTADCPTNTAPLDLNGVLDVLVVMLEEDGGGETPLVAMEPIIFPLLTHENTWEILGNLSVLLIDNDAKLQDGVDLLVRLIALDPELTLLYDNVDLLADPALITPVLKIIESTELADAMGEAELTAEGPLPFTARLITSDILQTLLRTVDLVLETLGR
ncbi:MAG: hypothetical protein ACI8RZ_004564 [Myxococcota bacterium]|jgi:hypothetical protein